MGRKKDRFLYGIQHGFYQRYIPFVVPYVVADVPHVINVYGRRYQIRLGLLGLGLGRVCLSRYVGECRGSWEGAFVGARQKSEN